MAAASFTLPPRPGRPVRLGFVCGIATLLFLSPFVFFGGLHQLFLLSALPVGVGVSIAWGRIAARRDLVRRLEEALDTARKKLASIEEAEHAYALLVDALEAHPGVAGVALFVQSPPAGKSKSAPVVASGALLGLRALPRVTDVEHLAFMARESQVVHKNDLKARAARGLQGSAVRPLLSVLEDASLDLVWMLGDEQGPVGAIVLREAIGADFASRLVCDTLASRSNSFAQEIRRVSSRKPVVEEGAPPPAPASTASLAEDAAPAPASSPDETPMPSTLPRLPSVRASEPWTLLPPISRLAMVSPRLGEVWEEAQKRAGESLCLRLVGPRGSAARLIAWGIAKARGGNVLRFPTPENDPWEEVARWVGFGTILFDEERAGFRPDPLDGVLLIILGRKEEGALCVPGLQELDPLPLANLILEHIAPGEEWEISPEAEEAIKAHHWEGDLEELALALTRGVLVTSPGAPLTPQALGLSALQSPPPPAPEPPSELEESSHELPEADLQPFHDAVLSFKRALVLKALAEAGGNRAKAARLLSLQRTYLYRLIRQLGIDEEEELQKGFDETTAAR